MLTYMLKQKNYESKINLVFKALISVNKSRIEYKIFNDLFYELYFLGLVEINHHISSEFINSAVKKELERNETV